MKKKSQEGAESETWRLRPTLSIYNKKSLFGEFMFCAFETNSLA